MKHFQSLVLCIVVFIVFSPTLLASQNTVAPEIEKEVRALYQNFAETMSAHDIEKTLEIAHNNFSEDFLHLDEGQVTYDKRGLINILKDRKYSVTRTNMDIEILELKPHATDEVFVKMRIRDALYNGAVEDANFIGETTLECNDFIRTGGEFVELYKCDCTLVDQKSAVVSP